MAAPSAGFAVLQVIPSVRGISDELRRQVVGPAGDAGDRAGAEIGGKLKSSLKAGAAAGAVLAGAAIVKGIGEAISQANITSTLQAQLGTTNKVAAQHGKIAGKLYSTGVSDSFQGAADAIKAVVGAGLAPPGATTKQLQTIATKASDVANVFGEDLGGVTNQVAQLMRTGLAKNSTEAFDIIARGLRPDVNKAGDFLDVIGEYSTQFRKAGVSGGQALGLIKQGLQGGARDADIVADAIKEFSIRAVDGSKLTAEGFKGLGLNADDMAKKFSQGGAVANGALDLTLDRLRDVPDKTERSRLAVALFGTQAEDLGDALFALDPSAAAKKIGDFGGAADKMGKTIRSGPSHEITVFTRALKQGFVDFLGGKVLPIITQAGQFFNTYLLPPISTVASVMAAVLVPALGGLFKAGRGVVNWLRDMGTWLIPIAIAVGGLALAMSTSAIAAGAQALAIGAVTLAMRVARGISLAFAGAQAVLNAVMAANPIILVVALIAALVAAIVIAYKRSETFRNIVQAVGRALVTAWNAIWKALSFVFNWIKDNWKTLLIILTGPIGLAVAVIIKYWDKINGAFQTVLNWVKSNWPYILGFLLGPIALAAAAIYKHWGQVRDFFLAAWQFIVRNVLTPIRTFFTSTIPGWAGTVRDRVVSAWGTLRDRVYAVYAWVRDHVFSPLRTFFTSTIPGWAGTVRDRVAGAFGTLRDRVHGAYTWVRDHVFYKIRDFFTSTIPGWARSMKDKVVGFFEDMRDGLGTAWDGIKSKAKSPINWVIRNVWNNGIVSIWKKITGWIGLGNKLGTIKELASGGTVGAGFGQPATPGIFNRPTAIVGEGNPRHPEFVIPTDPRYATRARALWEQAGAHFMARGGIIPDPIKNVAKKVGGAIKGVGQFLIDPLGSAKKLFAPFLDKLDGIRNSPWGEMIAKFPGMAVNGLLGLVKRAAGSIGGAIGLGDSSVRGSAQQYAQLYMKTLGWGPSQWPALKSLWQAESGWNPLAHNKSSGAHGIPQALPASKMRSEGADYWTNPATQIRWGEKYIKRRYGSPVAAWSFWLRQRPHWYDEGGVLPPGLSLAYNGTRRPEPVLTERQWQAAFGGARGSDGGDVYNFYPRTLDMTVRDLDVLQRRKDAEARVGRPR